jgi:hypothetical protein
MPSPCLNHACRPRARDRSSRNCDGGLIAFHAGFAVFSETLLVKPEDFRKMIHGEVAKWTEVAKQADIRVQ